jgi:parallel beta-helix repeat protein
MPSWAAPEEPIDSLSAPVPDAIAQTPTPQGYTVLHVNAESGSDRTGDGSQLRPYQTITYALSAANSNSLILLAGGIYSDTTGEIFPLEMQTGVTIQGMAGPNAASVVIRGNGGYYSPANGARNITLLGAHNAGLANVTVSNPHPEGIGLWIESGSPVILDNAFFQNGLNGIYIAGSGRPVIRGNYFSENGQAGLVIAGPSSAEVEANVFENTGAGITVAPDATPQILNNQIIHNEDGLIIQGSARPTLQGNQISGNRRNTVVDYVAWSDVPSTLQPVATQPPPPVPSSGAATPDSTERSLSPTGETILEPDAPDIPAAAASAEVASVPPASVGPTTASGSAIAHAAPPLATVLSDEVQSALLPDSWPVVPNSSPAAIGTTTVLSEYLVDELSATSTAVARIEITPVMGADEALSRFDTALLSLATEELSVQTDRLVPSSPNPATIDVGMDDEAIDEPAFLPLPSAGAPAEPAAIALTVTPPPVDTVARPRESSPSESVTISPEDESPSTATSRLPALPSTPNLTSSEQSALQVPTQDIPMGNGGDLPDLFTAGAITLSDEAPPPPPSLAAALGLRYRVLVVATDAMTQEAVRAHVPDAFRTRLNGRVYLQVGAYPTLSEAEATVERLSEVNISAQIEEIL